MKSIVSKGNSLWVESMTTTEYLPLMEDMNVDVAIIGGGIAGLTAAYLLKQRGKQVAVFDKQRIASDVSGHTTGKITSQHGKTYTDLIKQHGIETAKLYAKANQQAIAHIERIVNKESIDCDFQRRDDYVFTQDETQIGPFMEESDNARTLGLPASFSHASPLPFPVAAAVKFTNQATFHVGNYLQGLAAAIHGNGCTVYENTKVTSIRDGSPCTFTTPNGRVKANTVVIATNVPSPLVMHGYYGLQAYPVRSYLVAGRLDQLVEGMHISTDKPSRSILPITFNNESWLLVGGEGHFAGTALSAEARYKKLAQFARENFGVEATRKWSTWDYIGYDKLPLVGKAYPWSGNIYTATGFRKWGMTNGTVAGEILADMLTGKESPYAHAFRTNRKSVFISIPKGLVEGLFS